MKKIIAFLMIVLMMMTFVSCDLSEDIESMSSELVGAGADALGDYLKEDPAWANAD